MHINTESKAYKTFRNIASYASFTGGCLAFDSVVIPFVYAVFSSKKLRLARYLGMLGTYGMSMVAGRVAEMPIDETIDAIVEYINLKDEEKNPSPEVEQFYRYDGIDVPGKNATPAQERIFINDLVAKRHILEFETEEGAKHAIELASETVEKYGHCDLALFCAFAGKAPIPHEVYDIAVLYGWTKDDMKDWGVDKIDDGNYIADMFNYHSISEVYDILESNSSKED